MLGGSEGEVMSETGKKARGREKTGMKKEVTNLTSSGLKREEGFDKEGTARKCSKSLQKRLEPNENRTKPLHRIFVLFNIRIRIFYESKCIGSQRSNWLKFLSDQ